MAQQAQQAQQVRQQATAQVPTAQVPTAELVAQVATASGGYGAVAERVQARAAAACGWLSHLAELGEVAGVAKNAEARSASGSAEEVIARFERAGQTLRNSQVRYAAAYGRLCSAVAADGRSEAVIEAAARADDQLWRANAEHHRDKADGAGEKKGVLKVDVAWL